MSGTVAGGHKAVASVKASLGPDHYKRIGSLGGKISKRHLTYDEAAAMGAVGGKISRRTYPPK